MMIDVIATNDKLVARSLGMVREIAGVDKAGAQHALAASAGHVKLAILVAAGLDADAGRTLLDRHAGNLRAALAELGR
jgi:N-acetylmuramic acid 6-phosphate etherase